MNADHAAERGSHKLRLRCPRLRSGFPSLPRLMRRPYSRQYRRYIPHPKRGAYERANMRLLSFSSIHRGPKPCQTTLSIRGDSS